MPDHISCHSWSLLRSISAVIDPHQSRCHSAFSKRPFAARAHTACNRLLIGVVPQWTNSQDGSAKNLTNINSNSHDTLILKSQRGKGYRQSARKGLRPLERPHKGTTDEHDQFFTTPRRDD